MLDKADTNNKIMWRVSRALKTKNNPVPAIHSRNGLVYTAQDKAEAISEELQQQCYLSYQHADLDLIAWVHHHVRIKLRGNTSGRVDEYVTPQDVKQKLNATKLRKAPGPDVIPGAALRALPRKAVMALTNIINAMFRLAHFPSNFDKLIIP